MVNDWPGDNIVFDQGASVNCNDKDEVKVVPFCSEVMTRLLIG